MKIYYDHQAFTMQRYGGISRYFVELSTRLSRCEGITIEAPALLSNNYYYREMTRRKVYSFFGKASFRGQLRFMRTVNNLYAVPLWASGKYDIFHPTYYDPYFLRMIGRRPFVVTVYDMIHEKFASSFPRRDRTSEQKRLLVSKAAKVIAISESTKRDIIETLDVEPSKIEVIYLASSLETGQSCQASISSPERYLLFVGKRDGYKNFATFIEAAAELLQKDRDLFVVCAGGGGFTAGEVERFNRMGLASRVVHYEVTDATLAHLYRNAQCFVFPSLYEGFGIPVLEAFSCGCPLLCSNVSSLPEIAGGAALLFDPHRPGSIYAALTQVLTRGPLQQQLREAGYEREKHFSWEKTARETKKLYEGVYSAAFGAR